MNHPFIHLLWKSYRSQRGIWLTMLGGMLLLQLLLLANMSRQENPFTIALFITTLIAPAFLCVSTLLMFVMEEEQGTALWLRLLPIKWWQQLTAGLLCSVALTAAIALSGITAGWISTVYHQSGIPSQPLQDVKSLQLLTVLPIWLVGLTVSILIRRVIIVLPIVVAIAITNLILTFQFRITWLTIAASIVAACVLPFAVRRWQLGRPWTWWSKTASSNIDSQTVAISRINKPSLRGHLLRRIAMTDGLHRRTTLVLYWQELRQALPFAMIMLCVGLGCVVYHHAITFLPPVHLIWLFFFTLECGLRSFRHDQQKQHGLFWAHRGVSPTKIWMIKNCVWLPVLLVVSFAAFWLDQRYSWLLGADPAQDQHSIYGMLTSLADPLATQNLTLTTELINGSQTTVHNTLITLLATGYFVGQLWSVWLRPPLVAYSITLLCFFAIPIWIWYSQLMDVPLTSSAWPIAVICAITTVCTGRSWMDRRQDGRTWIKRITVVCLLPVSLWLGHRYYRGTQIPSGCQELAYEVYGLPMTTTPSLMSQKLSPMNENSTTDALWRELLMQEKGINSRTSRLIIEDLLATQNWDQSLLPVEFRTSWQASIVQPLHLAVTSEVHGLVHGGKAGEALQLLLQGIKLVDYLATQTTDWEELEKCTNFLRNLHQHIHCCASSNQVTTTDLLSAADQFDGVQDYSTAVAHMLQNRRLAFLKLMDQDSDLKKWLSETSLTTFTDRRLSLKRFVSHSSIDRARHDTLLKATSQSFFFEVLHTGKFPLKLPIRWQHQMGRWAQTTPKFGFERDPMLIHPTSALAKAGPMVSINAAINIRKATWWILQAQLYRREFGRMPTEAELRNWLQDNGCEEQIGLFIDSMNSEPFDFRLQGSGVLTQSQLGSQILEVHAQQPLIGFTANLSTLGAEETANLDIVCIPINPDRIVYLERAAWIHPQPPIRGKLADLLRNPGRGTSDSKDAIKTDQTDIDE